MSELVMPRLSDTMEEGTILRWLKADGEPVARGEELVEIETDKATMVYESDLAGVLRILAEEGSTLAVGEPIATVAEQGAEDGAPAAPPLSAQESPGTPPQSAQEDPIASEASETQAPQASLQADSAVAEAAAPETEAAEPPSAPGRAAPEPALSGDARVKASPLARRIARENGLDLRSVSGSGPGGRIVKADVLQGAGSSAADAPTAPAGESSPSAARGARGAGAGSAAIATAKGETTELELSRTQQTIARRMAESKATIPDFSIQAEVDMEACVALRGELKRLAHSELAQEPGAEPSRATPTYNDMVVKASALALREHPRANGSYRDGRLQLHSRVNVGVAVAAEDALVVPTVFDADSRALGEIARETRRLAERVRERTITPPELGGGTFTVSNLGMYGVRSFTPIINPPQAAILSVGSLAPRAAVREGELVARHTMILTLVCDHRILYGADAAQLLARIRELLEAPSALTL